jgi:hypothetical protein
MLPEIDIRSALGLVMLSPVCNTADGTLQVIGHLRATTRLLEGKYAQQVAERHDPPAPVFLQRKTNGEAAPKKNKGGRPRKQAAQPAMFPPAETEPPRMQEATGEFL